MGGQRRTMFRLLLIPLIILIAVQSAFSFGMVFVTNTFKVLRDDAVGTMTRTVENRKVVLENDMIQRWASICQDTDAMNRQLEKFFNETNSDMKKFISSGTLQEEYLNYIFPEWVDKVQYSMVTGAFVILENDGKKPETYDGFYVHHSDIASASSNKGGLLMERGDKQLARSKDIPLDVSWTPNFEMMSMGSRASDDFFYKPLTAAKENIGADPVNLGYWSQAFALEDESRHGYQRITYSLPLIYDNVVYGVAGVEISLDFLNTYFNLEELNENGNTGYVLAIRNGEEDYTFISGKGSMYQLLQPGGAELKKTGYKNFYDLKASSGMRLCAVSSDLDLYGSNVPYQDTDWILVGLNSRKNVFGLYQRMYYYMGFALFIGMVFGMAVLYVTLKKLLKPFGSLMQCIQGGTDGIASYQRSNIEEIEDLYDVISDLTTRQKLINERLSEEKERYRLAMEGSDDTFITFEFKTARLEVHNHSMKVGKRDCSRIADRIGFYSRDDIYWEDQELLEEQFEKMDGSYNIEFRLKSDQWDGYRWQSLKGTVIKREDGDNPRLVGSIKNIHKQKLYEIAQKNKEIYDTLTGLYTKKEGVERINAYRKEEPNGTFVYIRVLWKQGLDNLYGQTFKDLILEEIGNRLREYASLPEDDSEIYVIMRAGDSEFLVWIPGTDKDEPSYLEEYVTQFGDEAFNVREELLEVGVNHTVVDSDMDVQTVMDEIFRQYSVSPIISSGNDVKANMLSLVLSIFDKGGDFGVKMDVLLRKLGNFYHAKDVLLLIVNQSFSSIYPEYQWHRQTGNRGYSDKVRCDDEELWAYNKNLSQGAETAFVPAGTRERVFAGLNSFLGEGNCFVVPLVDDGLLIGFLCLLDVEIEEPDVSDTEKELREIASIIQNRLNTEKHDVASRAKMEFLTRISHEIRTPMNGIIGMTEIALKKDQSRERITDCLEKIRRSSRSLLKIVSRVLDISNIESGRMKLEPVEFDITEMLEDVHQVMSLQAKEKDIDFEVVSDVEHTFLSGDSVRISQVLYSLLGNALKFTEPGGKVSLRVKTLSSDELEDEIYFEVKDNGSGISSEDQQRIFQSFEQAGDSGEMTISKGVGLGLTVSSRLVHMMGGEIELLSAPDQGSAFHFTLPLERREKKEETVSEDAPVSFEGFRVLVVEDNELNAEIICELLEDHNFTVDVVFDGEQAVNRLEEAPEGTYDVVLMDIMMPVMDGMEATSALRHSKRQDLREIPIVAVSANAFDEDMKRSLECGMNGHLSKPVNMDLLLSTLEDILFSDRGE